VLESVDASWLSASRKVEESKNRVPMTGNCRSLLFIMTQAQRFTAVVLVLGTIYTLTYLSIIPVPLLEDVRKNEILPVVCPIAIQLLHFAKGH
jgi:succinate dehydrogenase hydrophobic anchor subunit